MGVKFGATIVNNFWLRAGRVFEIREQKWGERDSKTSCSSGLVQRFMPCDASEGNEMIGCFIYSREKPSLSTVKRAVVGIDNSLSLCVSLLSGKDGLSVFCKHAVRASTAMELSASHLKYRFTTT
ncbi:hypothetical protein CEXT_371001 [Caerostris extrusa]|uniref:Uncharacterized protein n=1 Tax=Caerostris extrusa TaxID=172846 RepID=A0AAV4RNF8_CAEEX|nr:hypothetical protein CEXT_371001 [Caerostris extrusa]